MNFCLLPSFPSFLPSFLGLTIFFTNDFCVLSSFSWVASNVVVGLSAFSSKKEPAGNFWIYWHPPPSILKASDSKPGLPPNCGSPPKKIGFFFFFQRTGQRTYLNPFVLCRFFQDTHQFFENFQKPGNSCLFYSDFFIYKST